MVIQANDGSKASISVDVKKTAIMKEFLKSSNDYSLEVIKKAQIKKGKTSHNIPEKLFEIGKRYKYSLIAQGTGNYKKSESVKSKALKGNDESIID